MGNINKSYKAIEEIEKACPSSEGKLVYLKLDLGDLTTIKASADEFLSKESRLNVMFLNAGVVSQVNAVAGYMMLGMILTFAN